MLPRSVGFAAVRFPASGTDEVELARLCAETALVLPGSLDRAVPKRRAEFVAGRMAIASAAASVGLRAQNVARSDGGAPFWPAGLVGSVTHCDGLACAIVSSVGNFVSLGIDLERICDEQEAERLRPMVSGEAEWEGLSRWSEDRGRRFTAIFSAKEAVYKFIHPLVRRFVDFGEVFVEPVVPGQLRVRFEPPLARETGMRDLAVEVERRSRYLLTICHGGEFRS